MLIVHCKKGTCVQSFLTYSLIHYAGYWIWDLVLNGRLTNSVNRISAATFPRTSFSHWKDVLSNTSLCL